MRLLMGDASSSVIRGFVPQTCHIGIVLLPQRRLPDGVARAHRGEVGNTDTAVVKVLALRRADTCTGCGAELPAGTKAAWDAAARTVRCVPCTTPADSAPTGFPTTAGPTHWQVSTSSRCTTAGCCSQTAAHHGRISTTSS